ncbi:ImmA/IrrE family metallo-endopeptidase [Brevibacillus composti]|uniref:ImmA/IrrE family metallo-endopeptidase n=2 Tax=Brevibacillus composti TaxID=2796470 RepID=A0A7T5JQN7_9BACL|nr:ImmA/IrrE family metallo-endopeptidase [Brevibacillus composti]QUO43602.1 ImmA/IrrE family metallo-endopeptidase [Brevibacillus composti]
MTKKRISKPNYKRAQNAAYELLKISNTRELPVKVKKLAKHFPNLKIKTYSWFAKKHGMTLSEVCEFANSDEGCCWYIKSKNRYVILYNDMVENAGRIRWTVAHELGHYILGHNESNNKTIIARSSLTDEEYDIFEKEANCFARTLLAPPNVLASLDFINPYFISELCLLSYEASCNVYKFISEGINRGIRYSSNHPIVTAFSNYIYREKNKKNCLKCNGTFVSKDAIYCPICGDDQIIKGIGEIMKYSGIEIDEIHRAIECPKCQNENVIGDYCQICGSYLVNKCTGFSDNGRFNRYQGPWHIDFEDSCGKYLDGDARFCTQCGSTSTFYEAGLLKSWETLKIEQVHCEMADEAAAAGAEFDPFADPFDGSNKKPLNISDEDLPF